MSKVKEGNRTRQGGREYSGHRAGQPALRSLAPSLHHPLSALTLSLCYQIRAGTPCIPSLTYHN